MIILPMALATGAQAATEARHVGVGSSHIAIIHSDGSLKVAGANSSGQLGDGTSVGKTIAIQVATGVRAVATGAANTFWIKNDGTLWATGEGASGQLGDGGDGSRYVPMQVATGVKAVAAGSEHSAYVKTDGTLWTAGYNTYGQLGSGNTVSPRFPIQVATSVSAVAAGDRHTLFLKTDGTLWGCGFNFNGELGIDTSPNWFTLSPKQIASGVIAIAAGGSQSYFIKSDNTLWGMGSSDYGQMGDGASGKRLTPIQIASGVKAVATGSEHLAYLKIDGTLWATGGNGGGQLGDGTSVRRYAPIQVANGVTFVTAGGAHTVYGTEDGSIWGAGTNSSGEFGGGEASFFTISPPVRVVGPPSVITQPVGRTVNPGASVPFAVTFSGPAPVTIQWRRDQQAIPGATSKTYNFTAQEANEGTYDVVLTNAHGAAVSTPVVLDVNDPVTITQPPVPVAVMPGGAASFSVTASGTEPLTYQWRKNGSTIAGAVSSVLNLDTVAAADAATYTCSVSNVVGSLTSTGAALTIGPVITSQPQSRTVNPNATFSFTVTATGSSLKYQWRRNGIPISGASSSSYSTNGTPANEGNYDVIVSNDAGAVTSSVAILNVNAPVVITAPPKAVVASVGQAASFSVAASGTGPLTYQWRRNGIAIEGETDATLNIESVAGTHPGLYTCAVSNVVGTVTSAAAELIVRPEITSQPASRTVSPGDRVTFSVHAEGTSPLTYRWSKGGAEIATGPTLTVLSASESDEGEYSVLVSNVAGSVVSERAMLLVNDLLKITKHPQSRTVVPGESVMFYVEAEGSGPLTYQWRKGGEDMQGATESYLLIDKVDEADAGAYDVVVRNNEGPVTSNAASLNLNLTPRIVREPSSVAVRAGATVKLSVVAAGVAPLSFQWFHNNVPIEGATDAMLELVKVSASSIGGYWVRVSNGSAAVMSATAIVSFAEWTAIAGNFQGLLTRDNAADATDIPWPGRLTLTVSGSGRLSGRLEYEGQTFPFAGPVTAELSFIKSFPRSGQAPIALHLQLNAADGTLWATTEVATSSADIVTTSLSASRHVFHASRNPAPGVGRYVVVLHPADDPTDAPSAPGYATVQITASGSVSMVGRLPDGAKISSGGYLGEDGVFPSYASLYKKGLSSVGQLAGLVTFESMVSDQAVVGALDWRKPGQRSGPYSGGFNAFLPVSGAFYTPPKAGEVVLELPQGGELNFSVRDSGTELLFERPVNLSSKNFFKVSGPNPEKSTLKLDVRTGLMKGSFAEPATRTKRVLQGVLIPPSAEAIGFYLMGDQAGSWELSPQ